MQLALRALRNQQMADLLTRMPARKLSGLGGGLGKVALSVLLFVMLVASPAMLAAALTAAVQGNSSDTTAALYGLGVVLWLWNVGKTHDVEAEAPGNLDEQAYAAWYELGAYRLRGDWVATGAGAKAYLNDMLSRGLPFPLIGIDLAEALHMGIFGTGGFPEQRPQHCELTIDKQVNGSYA